MISKFIFAVLAGLIVYFSINPAGIGQDSFLQQVALTPSGFYLHAAGYFCLGIAAYFAFKRKYIWGYLFVLCGVSFMLEYVQNWIPLRVFNLSDVVGNGIGLLGAGIVIFIGGLRGRERLRVNERRKDLTTKGTGDTEIK